MVATDLIASGRFDEIPARGPPRRYRSRSDDGSALRPASECRYDVVSLGEVMLRLDPGEGRIRTARTFRAWEGGGEYNVARGLRRCFGLRTGDRHRLRRQRGRPAAGGPRCCQGGVDTSLRALDAVRRHRPRRPQRAQLHRARLRRPRRRRGLRPGHTAAASCARATSTGTTCSAPGRALVPHRWHLRRRCRETTPDGRRGGDGRGPAHGTVVSYDLNYRPSLWKAIGGPARAQEVNRRLAPLRRRDDRQRGGLHRLPRLRGAGHATRTSSTLDAGQFKAMIGDVVAEYPTLPGRRDDPARRAQRPPVNDWGAVAWSGGRVRRGDPPAGPGDPRPRRRRRQLRLGPDLWPAGDGRPADWRSSTARPTARWR